MLRAAALLASGCLAAGTASCRHRETPAVPGPAVATPSGRLEGTVTYRQRIALAPGAVIRVSLADTSEGGPRWHQVITTAGENVPIPFSIPFDPSAIHPDRTYFAVASIVVHDRMIFSSPSWIPALGPGAPNSLELVLSPPDPVVGTWLRVIPTQESRREGLALSSQGALSFISICSMDGVSWRRAGDTLLLATRTDRYPVPVVTRAAVETIGDSILVFDAKAGYFAGRWSRLTSNSGRLDECVR